MNAFSGLEPTASCPIGLEPLHNLSKMYMIKRLETLESKQALNRNYAKNVHNILTFVIMFNPFKVTHLAFTKRN